MSLKLAILFLFAAVVASLFSGLFFLIHDRGSSKRLANALFIRVLFSAAIIIVLIYGFYSGQITPHMP